MRPYLHHLMTPAGIWMCKWWRSFLLSAELPGRKHQFCYLLADRTSKQDLDSVLSGKQRTNPQTQSTLLTMCFLVYYTYTARAYGSYNSRRIMDHGPHTNATTWIERLFYEYLYQCKQRAANVTVDFIVQQNKRFLLFNAWQKDTTRKSAFFAYVISRKWRATQRKKLQGNVFQLKWRPHAKIQLIWSKKSNQNCPLSPCMTSFFIYSLS